MLSPRSRNFTSPGPLLSDPPTTETPLSHGLPRRGFFFSLDEDRFPIALLCIVVTMYGLGRGLTSKARGGANVGSFGLPKSVSLIQWERVGGDYKTGLLFHNCAVPTFLSSPHHPTHGRLAHLRLLDPLC